MGKPPTCSQIVSTDSPSLPSVKAAPIAACSGVSYRQPRAGLQGPWPAPHVGVVNAGLLPSGELIGNVTLQEEKQE